jgi:hypothetical protein
MKNAKIAWGHLKVFSGTVSPEKFKFTWQLSESDMVKM